MNKKEYSIELGGKTLTAEFNDLADQADGSVMLRYGNTTVLATAVMGDLKDGDFFPLTVDYEERFYATGKILGSRFVRREGRPSTEAILAGRIVDRTIRPLFNQKIRNEVQVIITTLSIDQDDPDPAVATAAAPAVAGMHRIRERSKRHVGVRIHQCLQRFDEPGHLQHVNGRVQAVAQADA
jgi:polyribonucleotide nucleotidyltransferase